MNPFFKQVVVPLGALLALVGGIAYLAQNLPNYRGGPLKELPPQTNDPLVNSELLFFTHLRARWNNDPNYFLEVEKGEAGSYWFPFEATSGKAVELGILAAKCDCVQLAVALLQPADWQRVVKGQANLPEPIQVTDLAADWQPLPIDARKGVELAPGVKGLLRVSWKGRREPGEKLNLQLQAWKQPSGHPDQRVLFNLEVPAITVAPLQFFPPRINLGQLGPGDFAEGELFFWSPTRPNLNVEIPAQENGPLQISLERLTPPQVQSWRDQIKRQSGKTSHIQCVYKVRLQVREADLNLGTFIKPLAIFLDGFPLEGVPPVVEGTVKGDLEIGGPNDKSTLQFPSFRARDGASGSLVLWSDARVGLELSHQHPKALKVILTRDDSGSTPAKGKWLLEVVVPPNSFFGPFTEDCAIWLRLGDGKRLVRIPLSGNAGS